MDARAGQVFSAADLDEVELQGASDGGRSTLRIRASDGEDWGRWDGFRLYTEATPRAPAEPKPAPEPAPASGRGPLAVEVDDIVIAPGRSASVADALRVSGGDVTAVQVFDGRGEQSFHFRDGRALDASKGAWISADRLDDLMVRGEDDGSSQPLRLRVADGGEVSDWDGFAVHAPEGWDGLA